MRRTSAIVLAAAFLWAALAQQPASARVRVGGTEMQTYQSEGFAAPTGVVDCSGEAVVSNGGISILGPQLNFPLPSVARRVWVAIRDTSGTEVMASLWR